MKAPAHRSPSPPAKKTKTPYSIFDLVMWRDVSKSAFFFGLGTFIIVSSSYTKDLNISLIFVVSYLGLVYLTAIFLFRSIICRGVIDNTSQHYVVGEEEAVWLLKMVLPYLNEFLLKIRALFFWRSFHHDEVGSAAVCSGKVWEFHNYLEDGQIGRFDSVIHFTGLTAVDESVQYPLKYNDNNLTDEIALLNVMAAHGCKKVQKSFSQMAHRIPGDMHPNRLHPQIWLPTSLLATIVAMELISEDVPKLL